MQTMDSLLWLKMKILIPLSQWATSQIEVYTPSFAEAVSPCVDSLYGLFFADNNRALGLLVNGSFLMAFYFKKNFL